MRHVSVTEYVLTEAYNIGEVKSKIKIMEIKDGEILLKPVVAGICGSDLLYFRGQKHSEKLKTRLPLVLLHEGVVQIVGTNDYAVVIPLQSCGICQACKNNQENLCQDAKFMASTASGLSRTHLVYSKNLILPIPKSIPLEVAAVSEPMSIAAHLIESLFLKGQEKIGIIGDGTMAYFCLLGLFFLKGCRSENIYSFGIKQFRLSLFKSFSQTIDRSFIQSQTQVDKMKSSLDVVIEAVGGNAMPDTIDQAISLLKPGGKLVILGLTDNLVPTKFAEVVKKGLKIIGVSRSVKKDFQKVLKLMENKKFQAMIKKIIDKQKFIIKNAKGLMNAFHYASSGRHAGKVLVKFAK